MNRVDICEMSKVLEMKDEMKSTKGGYGKIKRCKTRSISSEKVRRDLCI